MKHINGKKAATVLAEERFITLTANVPQQVSIPVPSNVDYFKIYYVIIRKGFSGGVLPATVLLKWYDSGSINVDIALDKFTLPTTGAPGAAGNYTTTADYKFYHWPQGFIVHANSSLVVQHTAGGMVEVKVLGERV